jgi:RNA polymerase sigma factor (sigma-70 family)
MSATYQTFESSTVTGVSDAQLLEQFATSRSSEAFTELVRRHGPMVLGVCRRMLRDSADADDAFQSVFLILARRAGSIGRRELLANWLYGVATRVALRARSVRYRTHQRETPMHGGADLTSDRPDPLAAAARHEARERVDLEVNRLPARYRTAIVLCYFQGMSKEEAAVALGAPAGTISTWLARARQMLVDALGGSGGGGAGTGSAGAGAITAAAVSDILTENISLPAHLAQAAVDIGIGGLAAAPAGVALLAKGTVTAMWLAKIKVVAAVLFTFLTLGGTVVAVIASSDDSPPRPQVVALAPTGAGPGANLPAGDPQGRFPAADGWVWYVEPMGGGGSLWATRGMVCFMDEDKGGLSVSLAYQQSGEYRAVAYDKDGKRYPLEGGEGGSSEGVHLFRHRLNPAVLPKKDVAWFGIEKITERGRTLRREHAEKKALELGLEILPRPRIGQAYGFSLVDTQGRQVRSEDYLGKVLIIDCWATWCGPCVAQLPGLKKLHQQHHEKGLEIVGVSMDFKKEKMQDFVDAMVLPWPQVLVPESREIRGIWQQVNGIHGIPRVLLIDRQGILRGDNLSEDELHRQVEALLAAK